MVTEGTVAVDEGTAKKLRMFTVNKGGQDVQQEVVTLADGTGTEVAPALEGGNLATIAGKDFATQTTLAAIKAKTDLIATAVNTSDVKQATRANLKCQHEREDVISLGGVGSPNSNGVQIVAGSGVLVPKVYDAEYEALAAGLHYFYFGTTNAPTTKRFLSRSTIGVNSKSFSLAPRVGAAGDGIWLYAAVSETNMPYDLGYVLE